MNIKKRWKNIILVFCMTIAMVSNTVTAHASALPNPEPGVAEVIDFVEYCQKHGLQYADDAAAKVIAIEDARTKYKVMTSASKTAVKKSIGKGVVQGANILGFAFTSAAVLDATLTLGAYVLENLFQIDEALAMRAVSAIDNVETGGAEYYNMRTDRWQASLLSGIEDLIGKRVTDEWVINSGLVERTGLDVEMLNNMTEAQAEFYQEYLTKYHVITMRYKPNSAFLSATYYVPTYADTVYISNDGSSAWVCQGYRQLNGYGSPPDVGSVFTYSLSNVCAGPVNAYTWKFNGLESFEYNFGGLPVYQLTANSPLPTITGTVVPICDPILVPMPDIEPVKPLKPNVDSYVVPSTDAEFEEALNNDAVMDNYIDSSGTDGGDDNGSDDDGDMPKLPYVGDGELEITDGIKGALYFVRDCFSRIWAEMDESGSVAVVAVPITLGIVAMIIGLGLKRGGK